MQRCRNSASWASGIENSLAVSYKGKHTLTIQSRSLAYVINSKGMDNWYSLCPGSLWLKQVEGAFLLLLWEPSHHDNSQSWWCLYPKSWGFAPVEEETRCTTLPVRSHFLIVLVAVTVHKYCCWDRHPYTILVPRQTVESNGSRPIIPTSGISPGSVFSLEDRIYRFSSDLLCWFSFVFVFVKLTQATVIR